jgi:hypothetical protein
MKVLSTFTFPEYFPAAISLDKLNYKAQISTIIALNLYFTPVKPRNLHFFNRNSRMLQASIIRGLQLKDKNKKKFIVSHLALLITSSRITSN